MARLRGFCVAVAVLGGLFVAGTTTAHAAGCSTSSGVTVVVDFAGLGGGIRTGCAASPATGLDALSQAGFGYVFASRQPGFVCRIDGAPNAQQDPCVNTSPTSAYWSYWHAGPGGSWSYSNLGPGSANPVPGSVEGWAFGSGQQPGLAPPSPPSPPQPTTQPQPTPPTQPAHPTTQPAAHTPTLPPSHPTTTTAPPAASSVPAAATSSTTPPTTPGPTSVLATASTAPAGQSGGGSPTGLIIGGVLVVLLGGLGWWLARRRRAGS